MPSFHKATRLQSKLRLAFIGPPGSGKTYSALAVGTALGKRVALIDTEHGSASKYAGIFEFDTCELSVFSPNNYIEAIKAANGYDVIVIDSLSHAWAGTGGALDMVNDATARSKSNNSYFAWREVTPVHNQLIEAILQSNAHVIGTMRSKTEYVIETNERGKSVPRKIGMAPIQREGMEYEFDIVGDLDFENKFIVSKTRCPVLSKAVIEKPGKQLAETLIKWLSEGQAGAPGPEPVAPVKADAVHAQQEAPQRAPAPQQPVAVAASAKSYDKLTVLETLKKLNDKGGGPKITQAIKKVANVEKFAQVPADKYPALMAELGA